MTTPGGGVGAPGQQGHGAVQPVTLDHDVQGRLPVGVRRLQVAAQVSESVDALEERGGVGSEMRS